MPGSVSTGTTGTTSPTSARLRSGSLNLLYDSRPSFSPFGPSIWANNNSSQTSQATQPQPDNNNRLSQQSLHSIGSNTANEDELDPMQPFLKELTTMKTDVNRLRSYTVNGGAPFEFEEEDEGEFIDLPYMPQQHLTAQQAYRSQQQQQQQQQQHTLDRRLSNPMLVNRPRAATASGPFDSQIYMRYNKLPVQPGIQQQQQQLPPQPPQPVRQYSDYPLDVTMANSLEDPTVGPTRSLYLGNIPSNTASYTLQAIFSSYGVVESARVLNHKSCGFVNFATIESAIHARSVLNGKELFTGSGPCRIGFAKVSTDVRDNTPSPENAPPESQHENHDIIINSNHNNSTSNINAFSHSIESGERDTSEPVVATLKMADLTKDMATVVAELGADHDEQIFTMACVKRAVEFTDFKSEIQAVPEPRPDRTYDTPTLREVRKKIDNGNVPQEAVEEIALDMLDEIAELSSDYVGNTVVQKLFDICSEPVKDLMLGRMAPYLAQIGVHKNGTWAAQKIIDVAGTNRQRDIITNALRPYTPRLFLDQYGNYVIQGCLKFGSPWNDFIFETMLTNFWEVAQGRFGSRAMRACLESPHVTKEQQRMLAACITLYAVPLATNANGALLLTWLLDTYTASRRHSILAPRLIPNLVQLCTHKLASLTVLKIINFKADPFPRQIIFGALFGELNDEVPTAVLEQVLSSPVHGPTFIYKIISVPVLGPAETQNVIAKIKNVLVAIKAAPSQGYKRLMDEIDLSGRGLGGTNNSNGNQNGRRGSLSNNYPMRTHSRGMQIHEQQQPVVMGPQPIPQQQPMLSPRRSFQQPQLQSFEGPGYLPNMPLGLPPQQGYPAPDHNARIYGGQYQKPNYDFNLDQHFDQLSLGPSDGGPYGYPGSLHSFSASQILTPEEPYGSGPKGGAGFNQRHDSANDSYIQQSMGYQQFPGQ